MKPVGAADGLYDYDVLQMKQVPVNINPVEFFAFLAGYDDYPTNGYQLAQAAKKRPCSEGLVAFFEAMPGHFENESEILLFAEDRSKPPWGSAISLEAPPDTQALSIEDVTRGT